MLKPKEENAMKQLQNTTKIVENILIQDEQTRSSDGLLYIKVLEAISNERSINYLIMPIPVLLTDLKKLDLPSIETVGRARRKIQSKNPELKATKEVEKFREEREELFKEYARS